MSHCGDRCGSQKLLNTNVLMPRVVPAERTIFRNVYWSILTCDIVRTCRLYSTVPARLPCLLHGSCELLLGCQLREGTCINHHATWSWLLKDEADAAKRIAHALV